MKTVIARPIIKFDPSNPEHRRDYHLFNKHRSWSVCKNRYSAKGTSPLPVVMRSVLVDYYLDKEFE